MKTVRGPRIEAAVLLVAAQRQTTATACSGIILQRPQTTSARRHIHASQRQIHTSQPKEQDAILRSPSASAVPPAPTPEASAQSGVAAMSALDCLPLQQILRTYLITSVSSSPQLLAASTAILRRMLESKSLLFSIERNPLARALLWHTFYRQFCAGETREQVQKVSDDLRRQGYSGVILEYALEVLKDAEGTDESVDIQTWRTGMLKSVSMAAEGDFVGLKWSGMGPAAMKRMKKCEPPSKEMDEAMNAVCKAAAAGDISLLPAAEETWSLDGFHKWSLDLQRVYNLGSKSVVYNTYQVYLKQTPATLSQHLAMAKADGFTFGAKLVRGAYLGSEERSVICPSIEATHAAYDGIASALIHREHNEIIRPLAGGASWPSTNIVLATHNAISVSRAQELRRQQAARGEELTHLSFAQLQGMADEVSCTLLAAAKASEAEASEGGMKVVKEKVFKCTTWGSMYECLNYLLRRAAENKDAAGRTIETRRAMGAELGRRMRGVVGLA
ncbi:hypothetical protein LTR08_008405 [Meristemomyces frigidus]|nr:hypothetical protein LTR08_008405 [Meristemomyces frigidus]